MNDPTAARPIREQSQPTTARQVRIGIIGAGIAGERHAEAFAAHPGAALTAVAEPQPERGRAVARRVGAAYYADYRDMLAGPVDAVVVAVPHALHRACVVDAAAAGRHILLEKPIATTIDDAHAILDAVERAGVRLMMGYVHRFRPETMAARALIAEGRLGRPATALDRFMSGGMADTPGWVWNRTDAGGGVIMYGGVHAIDRLRWLLDDEVVEAYARLASYSNPVDVEDGVGAVLTFAAGATAVLYENAPGYGRLGGWVTEVFGSDGALVLTTGASIEYRGRDGTERWTYGADHRFERQAAEFVAALAEGRPPSVTGEDGLRGLEVALALYRSAATRRPEPVDRGSARAESTPGEPARGRSAGRCEGSR
jgi:predicted dehydrogenase